jgi:hypothetical protein
MAQFKAFKATLLNKDGSEALVRVVNRTQATNSKTGETVDAFLVRKLIYVGVDSMVNPIFQEGPTLTVKASRVTKRKKVA